MLEGYMVLSFLAGLMIGVILVICIMVHEAHARIVRRQSLDCHCPGPEFCAPNDCPCRGRRRENRKA